VALLSILTTMGGAAVWSNIHGQTDQQRDIDDLKQEARIQKTHRALVNRFMMKFMVVVDPENVDEWSKLLEEVENAAR